MLSSFKSKAAEQDRNTAANADELIGRTVQPSHTVVEQVASGPEPTATRKTGRDSCIGSGMSIVGKIECNGPAQVFGRIEGELRASDLLVGDRRNRSMAASLRRTSQSAAALRAPSVPFASSCRTVVQSRETFFIGRYQSMKTLSLRAHRGGLKIQPRYRLVLMPRPRRQKTFRARHRRPTSTAICSGWNRHSLTGPKSTVEPRQ